MVGLLAAAAGVWYLSGHSDRTHLREAAEAVKGLRYRVRCSACNTVFEMPASEYVTDAGPDGVRCQHCGQHRAWRIGDADEVDPTEFRAEAARMDSVGEVSAATKAAQAEFDRVCAEILACEGQPEKLAELRKKRATLQARLQALDARWDELTSK